MTETPQPKWTWEQIAAGRSRVGERFAERRSLWFTMLPHAAATTSHNAALAAFGEPLYDIIPQMCDDLNAIEAEREFDRPNAAEEQRHATERPIVHEEWCRCECSSREPRDPLAGLVIAISDDRP